MSYRHRFVEGSRCDLPPGKTVCVGLNYAAHVAEMDSAAPTEPVLFIKPRTALVPFAGALAIPTGHGACHFETEVALLIGAPLHRVGPRAAPEAIAGIGLALDLTLRDLQTTLRERGAPWEACKAFDGSAPLGPWQPRPDGDLQALRFSCSVNGELRQEGDTGHMLFPVARILRILSETWTLLPGDIIYTGTPAGVGPLEGGHQRLEDDEAGRHAGGEYHDDADGQPHAAGVDPVRQQELERAAQHRFGRDHQPDQHGQGDDDGQRHGEAAEEGGQQVASGHVALLAGAAETDADLRPSA